jgi:SMI1-KNR4 cell-wall
MLSFKPVTAERADEARIARLEQKLGYALPESYRQFLLQFNGGKPEKRLLTFVERDHEATAAIKYFFADCDIGLYSIEVKLKTYSGRIPEGYLPIACDSFGNLLLLSLSGEHRGEVYFWDHERELPQPGRSRNTHFVAATFEELIASLKDKP